MTDDVRVRFTYPVVFVDRELPKKYQVSGYPTFYLMDRDGKILYGSTGFGESVIQKVDSIVQANL